MNRAITPVLPLALLALASASPLQAAPPPATPAPAAISAVPMQATRQVAVNQSLVLQLGAAIKNVSVSNPGIADLMVLHERELYVAGKTPGTTNVVVWGKDGKVLSSFPVQVTLDIEGLKQKLHELMPDESIRVQSAEENLVLSGTVSSVSHMDAAKQVAQSFLPDCVNAWSDALAQAGKPGEQATAATQPQKDELCKKAHVVNLMQVGGAQQVMLKITVAEVARTVVRRLNSDLNIFNFGKNWSGGAVAGGATFPNALDSNGLLTPVLGSLNGSAATIGPPVSLLQPNLPGIDNTGIFLNYLRGNLLLNAVLDVSKRNGLARILSEPTLTALTGQEAQFISGGEFPVPVPQGNNNVAIEFKEYGVSVRFTPLVLDSGKINLNLNVTVSELSTDNNLSLTSSGTTATFIIPSLTKRSASSSVELADGQTIGIAGLINDNVRSYVERLPGLGEIPILGALFHSQQYLSGQTELVMFVTPHLAKPIAAGQMRLPTDGYVAPSDFEFYLLGRLEGGKPRSRNPAAAELGTEAAPQARFGHDL